MKQQLLLTPGSVTLEQLRLIYLHQALPNVDESCKQRVDEAQKIVINAAMADSPVYGINTGFGKLANTRIASEQTAQLQRNLILSHCCGVGEALSNDIVRLIMTLKMVSLARGASGASWKIIKQLELFIHHGIYPVIPAQGSVGASGDLAPLAHLTAALIGEGNVTYEGKVQSSSSILQQLGVEAVTLGPKEGLALINGTQVSTALALAGFYQSWQLSNSALVTGALSCDALMGSSQPFRGEIHALRNQPGQIQAAHTLHALLQHSTIRESHRKEDERVQDPYCLRCQPQVMGAAIDVLRNAGTTLALEANAVTDNPLVLVETNEILSGGNFHAEPVAFAADMIAIAVSEIGNIAERRIATSVDPALNYGLPAFLSPDPGINSGFMIAEVTAAAVMSENKHLSSPCSVDSTPTSANQEDHVSMACHAAMRLQRMNTNLSTILGIEWMTASQGIEFRQPLSTSPVLQEAIKTLRTEVEYLQQDRFMSDDLIKAQQMLFKGALVDSIPESYFPEIS